MMMTGASATLDCKQTMQHSWILSSHARPTFCNICREKLSGVTYHGMSCEVCKLKSHKSCVSSGGKISCKWTTFNTVDADCLSKEKDLVLMHHQWIEGNLPGSSKCAGCAKNCGSVLRLQDWRCLWCGATVHSSCKSRYIKYCSLGPTRHTIVPPVRVKCKEVKTNKNQVSTVSSGALAREMTWIIEPPLPGSPLIVFVNSKSGGGRGSRFLKRFRQILNPFQIYDLSTEGPAFGLQVFRNLDPLRLLICGGDGSVSWVLQEIDRMKLKAERVSVSVLPLGTGNDLARVCGWGSVVEDDIDLVQLIEKYDLGSSHLLDRWSIMSIASPVTRTTSSDCEQQTKTYEEITSPSLQMTKKKRNIGNDDLMTKSIPNPNDTTSTKSSRESSTFRRGGATRASFSSVGTMLRAAEQQAAILLVSHIRLWQLKIDEWIVTSDGNGDSEDESHVDRIISFIHNNRQVLDQTIYLLNMFVLNGQDDRRTENNLPYSSSNPSSTYSHHSNKHPSMMLMSENISKGGIKALSENCLQIIESLIQNISVVGGGDEWHNKLIKEMCINLLTHFIPLQSNLIAKYQIIDIENVCTLPHIISPPTQQDEGENDCSEDKDCKSGSDSRQRLSRFSRASVKSNSTKQQKQHPTPLMTVVSNAEPISILITAPSVECSDTSSTSSSLLESRDANGTSSLFNEEFQSPFEDDHNLNFISPLCWTPGCPWLLNSETLQSMSDIASFNPSPTTSFPFLPQQPTPAIRLSPHEKDDESDSMVLKRQNMNSSSDNEDSQQNNVLQAASISDEGNSTTRGILNEIDEEDAGPLVASNSLVLSESSVSLDTMDSTDNGNGKSDKTSTSSLHSSCSIINEDESFTPYLKPVMEDLDNGESSVSRLEEQTPSTLTAAVAGPSTISELSPLPSPKSRHGSIFAAATNIVAPSDFRDDQGNDRSKVSRRSCVGYESDEEILELETKDLVERKNPSQANNNNSADENKDGKKDFCEDDRTFSSSSKTFKVHPTPPLSPTPMNNGDDDRSCANFNCERDDFPWRTESEKLTIRRTLSSNVLKRLTTVHEENNSSVRANLEQRLKQAPIATTEQFCDVNNSTRECAAAVEDQMEKPPNKYNGGQRRISVGAIINLVAPQHQQYSSSINGLGGGGGGAGNTATADGGGDDNNNTIVGGEQDETGLVSASKNSHPPTATTAVAKSIPIINPLVANPNWPYLDRSSSNKVGLVSMMVLATTDALCAPVTPILNWTLPPESNMKEISVMNNYFGIGLDAKISLDFHNKRQEQSGKQRSRAKNYMLYGILGSREVVQKTYKNLEKRVLLECDGETIPLPSLQGIVVLNIQSFMGGTNFWGNDKDDKTFLPASFDDGILEVLAVFGSIHMGASRIMNLQRHRIAQCRSVIIRILGDEGVPIQVDGEAWVHPPGIIKIVHKNRVQLTCRDRLMESQLRSGSSSRTWYREHVHPVLFPLDEEELHLLNQLQLATKQLLHFLLLLHRAIDGQEGRDLGSMASMLQDSMKHISNEMMIGISGSESRRRSAQFVCQLRNCISICKKTLSENVQDAQNSDIAGRLSQSIYAVESILSKCHVEGDLLFFTIRNQHSEDYSHRRPSWFRFPPLFGGGAISSSPNHGVAAERGEQSSGSRAQSTTPQTAHRRLSHKIPAFILQRRSFSSQGTPQPNTATTATPTNSLGSGVSGSKRLSPTNLSTTVGDSSPVYYNKDEHGKSKITPDISLQSRKCSGVRVSSSSGCLVEIVLQWDLHDVSQWLECVGLPMYAHAFHEHEICGRELLALERRDFKDVGITKVGHIKRLQRSIKDIEGGKLPPRLLKGSSCVVSK